MVVLVGADPEIFLVDKQGRFRSAYGVIPGTKKEPFKVDRGAVQVDGMATEFNIDPAATEDEFVLNLTTVMNQLRDMVAPKFDLAIVPTARFHGNHMRVQPKEALELGCEPDFNAHDAGKQNPRPDNKTTMRTAAGHVHIGFTEGVNPKDEDHLMRCITLVKQLDAYLGYPSLLWDGDCKRRAMYGCAGAFRPKSYGVEYRTLSNRWLSDERLMRYVFQQVQAAVESLKLGERFSDFEMCNIQQRINFSRGVNRVWMLGTNIEFPPHA